MIFSVISWIFSFSRALKEYPSVYMALWGR